MTEITSLPVVSELTLTEPGWYWFEAAYPVQDSISTGHFVNIGTDTIACCTLRCRRHKGDYYGPIKIVTRK